ncbi:SH3 domain-containing protein [Halovulum dunhuangense]|uniref:SH3 domain-containing protein n=1 Tax=Halovulum dunhuangense TaxID=1505036 RepID=A0A849KYW9_9RHOB|nr:SH3 domain-containing protein [Halovulum dunhuangense]NNU79022.1 SH3 domain-containing protein [Halovulum dunhuangense]
MIRLLIQAAALCLALPAAAQTVPWLHDVSGVAADDVLHVRENPRATAGLVGSLPPDATGVEVVALSESGDWAQVNIGEASGWVSMSYLAAQPGANADGTYFDRPLRCVGTEPFWTLNVTGGDGPVDLTQLSGASLTLSPELRLRLANMAGAAQLLEAATPEGGRTTATLRRQQCSDGMSDRAYGLSLDMLIRGPGGDAAFVSGCCTLAAR